MGDLACKSLDGSPSRRGELSRIGATSPPRRSHLSIWLLVLLASAVWARVKAASPTYLNTAADVAYVGSSSCQGCHEQVYTNHFTTAMGRSMVPASDPSQVALVPGRLKVKHPRLSRYYEVYREDAAIYQTEYELDASGAEAFRSTHRLDYAVGSGTRGISYLIRRGEHLFQAPLSYYTGKGSWELSPGYESADFGFQRQIESSCLACHAGRPSPVAGKPGFYQDPPFEELGISCESCHGPGELHVAARLEKLQPSTEIDRTIFQPAKAPARLGENVCMRCHQWGDSRVPQSGKTHFDFRPGTSLYESLAILKVPPQRSQPEEVLLEHHFGMEMSACFRESAGALSCFSCHEVHNPPDGDSKIAYFRDKCLACHSGTDESAGLSERTGHAREGDCISCHMPRLELTEIRHTALTNHRIPARPDAPLPDGVFGLTTEALPDLVVVNPPGDRDQIQLPALTRFRAYAEIAATRPEYRTKYLDVLSELEREAPNDPAVLAALGHKAKLEKSTNGNGAAIRYLSEAVEAGTHLESVYFDLAEVLNRGRRYDEALEIVAQGLEWNPFSAKLSRMRIFTHLQKQRFGPAEEAIREHHRLFPADAEIRELLRKVDAANAAP